MSTTINGTSGVTFPDGTNQTTSPFTGGLGFRNRIINGDFRIDQRNAGASVTPSSTYAYNVDRWATNNSQASKYTLQQNAGSVTPPVGFTKYIGVTSSSAYSVVAADYFYLTQAIEGLNVADLGWGSANAQAVTLSFLVRSSLTGTFGGSIRNGSANRSYPFSFTIPSANTWTTISVTIAGDTSGTWTTDNSAGMYVSFSLGAGSTYSGTAGSWATGNYVSATGATSVVGTNGATFYITGVQLEKGSTATSFDYRPYGTELALCQRYYETAGMIVLTATIGRFQTGYWKVTKRATPTLTLSAGGTGATVAALPVGYGELAGFYQNSANSGDIQAFVTGTSEL